MRIKIPLKDISLRITKGTTPTTLGKDFIEQGINFIKAEALNGDPCLTESSFAFIDEETHFSLKRSILNDEDVLITIAGANIGKCGFVKEKYLPANTNQAVGIVRVDKNKACPRFVYYYFKQNRFFDFIQGLNAQAAQPNINLEMLGGIVLSLPTHDEQNRIAGFISNYDDLIENNLRRIELLEESSRILYREWFVHLRFPGHEHTKITNGVPEGWGHEIIEDVMFVRNGFSFKSNDYSTEGMPIVRTRDFSSTRYIERGENVCIPENLLDKYKTYMLNKWDFLLIMVGASLGKYGIVMEKDLPCLQNQNMWAIFTKDEEKLPQVYVLGLMEDIINIVMNYRVGAARDFFRKDFVKKQKIKVPKKALLIAYKEMIQPIYAQINNLLSANEKLRKARDILLPRLMNGDIAV